MAEGNAKRWFKYGCFGCLGCIGLVILVVGLTLGSAWLRSKSEKGEDRVLTYPVPSPKGTVILDLHDGGFHIHPGAAGDPVRVEATYDSSSYSLEESSEEAKDGTWTYRVEFHRTSSSSWLIGAFQHMFSSIQPSVRVFLPPGVPIALEATVERGGMEVELGGTHVISATFDVSMGGIELSVSEPLAEPMERLALKSHMGGGDFRSVGNASPRVIEVETHMGGLELDLHGAWRADADISLRGTMGGARVRLPEDVRIEGVPGRGLTGPQSGELKIPTLRITSSAEMGEIEFE